MTEDTFRTIGAIIGLSAGIGLMLAMGFSGIVFGALFGAGGCVSGAVTAEKLHAWKNQKGE